MREGKKARVEIIRMTNVPRVGFWERGKRN